MESDYQALLARFKEYDIEKAIASTTLQDASFAPDSAPMVSLQKDAQTMRTILDTCYEYAHRPHNFAPKVLRQRATELQALAKQLENEYPSDMDLASNPEVEKSFREGRSKFLEQLAEFAKALGAYAESNR